MEVFQVVGAIAGASLWGAVLVGAILGLSRWSSQCSEGGTHVDETIESSQIAPFVAKHRCTKCGRMTATATYGL